MLQLAAFEDILQSRKIELRQRLIQIESDLEQPGNQDSEERATEREGDEVLEGMGNAVATELRAIDAALDRISAGTFGLCVRCGQPISPQRLKVIPHATLCQDCIQNR